MASNPDLPEIDWSKSAHWPRSEYAQACGKWALSCPRYGAHWNAVEDADLQAAWGREPIEVIAERHGRECGHVRSRAISLGIEVRTPKPEKPAKVVNEPEGAVLKAATPKPAPIKPELPPDIKILCVAGLSENCARVILLAAQHMSHAEIAQVLALPSGVRSVSSYFQLAGAAWGIAGKGAHRAIVERASNLLQGRKV